MEIFIDVRGGTPIYDQIYAQIKGHILSGAMAEDTPLPSIRVLAKDLRVSVITTKRAYDELEHDGFIYTVAGKGSFVAGQNAAMIREEHLKQIERHMRDIRALAVQCGLTTNDVAEMYRLMEEEEI